MNNRSENKYFATFEENLSLSVIAYTTHAQYKEAKNIIMFNFLFSSKYIRTQCTALFALHTIITFVFTYFLPIYTESNVLKNITYIYTCYPPKIIILRLL